MNRFDRNWRGRTGGGFRGGYDSDLTGGAGFWDRGVGLNRGWGTGSEAPPRQGRAQGYDRGMRGYAQGGYAQGGYDRGPARGGYDRGSYGGQGQGQGQGQRYAREPFLPEHVYRQHPEMSRRPMHREDEMWEGRAAAGYGMEIGDDEVAQAVRESLYRDTWLDADRVEVEVRGGVVVLTGEVDDFLEARYAWDDAWETDGVRGVVNNLKVRAESSEEEQQQPSGTAEATSGADAGDAAAQDAKERRPGRKRGQDAE